MHRDQRLDSHAFFFDTVCATDPKMNLSIHWHRFFKDRRPINVPTREDGARIACDGEQYWRTINARPPHAVADVVLSVNHGNTHHRFLANPECVASLQSLRIALCFFFGHFRWFPSR
jgi:hypothetical protein